MTFQEKLERLLKGEKIAVQSEELVQKEEDTKNVENNETGENVENTTVKMQETTKNVENQSEKTENIKINTDPNKEPIYGGVKPKDKEELEKYLDIVERDYKDQEVDAELPEYLDLEEKEFSKKSQQDIEKEATAEADLNYTQNKEKLETEKQEEEKALEEQKKTLNEKAQELAAQTNTLYDHARVTTENDALKRGLARSSIVLLELSGIEEARAAELSTLQKDLEQNLSSVENQLQELSASFNTALKELDLARAAEIKEGIEAKVKEMEKAQNEVLEYNNKIKELEHKYNVSVDERRQKILAEKAEEVAELNKRIYQCKQNEQKVLLTNYYMQFSKERALLMLASDSSIASKVGADVYYAVYRNLLKREF